MNLSVGLLDFNEEKRIEEMFISSIFLIGSLYPETTFNKTTNIEFLKEQAFTMAMEGDWAMEKMLTEEKLNRAEKRTREKVRVDGKASFTGLMKSELTNIQKEMSNRKLAMKQKLYHGISDSKILKAANVGSAFSIEESKATVRPITKQLVSMERVKIMPGVIVERGGDLKRRIKSAYSNVIRKYLSLHQETQGALKMVDTNQGKKLNKAAHDFAAGNNPAYFNDLAKEHKQIDLSPEFTTRVNKVKEI